MTYSATDEACQTRLSALGYYRGVIDGEYGPLTAAAWSDFKAEHGMAAKPAPLLLTLPLLFSDQARAKPAAPPPAHVPPASAGSQVPPLLLVMRSLVGQREAPGTANNPRIQELARKAGLSAAWQDSDAWCAVTVNGAAVECGYPSTGSALAQSFRKWGALVAPADVQIGDVIVMPRGLAWQGHVEVVDIVHGDGTVTAIGGNVSDMVKRTRRKLSDLFPDGIRRPVKLAA